MKKSMSTLIIILCVAGIAYLALFNKPKNHSEAELQKWMSSKLIEISANIESDIEKDKMGEYPHAGRQSFTKRGSINYLLTDKHYARFDISDKNTLTVDDIKLTPGYKTLSDKINGLNLTLILEEKEVDGDDIESFNELDEYIDDYPRYYTVTISGW
jgi:hypothetical protein